MLFKDNVLEENDLSRSASLSMDLTFTAPTLPSQKGPFVHNPPPITPPPACILPIHKVIHTSLSDRPPMAFLNTVKTVLQGNVCRVKQTNGAATNYYFPLLIFLLFYFSWFINCLLYEENNHHSFPKPKVTASNCLFGMTCSPKQKKHYMQQRRAGNPHLSQWKQQMFGIFAWWVSYGFI